MEDLMALVKSKLKITWEDEDTNFELEKLLEDATETLTFKLGLDEEFDFTEPSQERRLFLNYCLYAYNDMENKFDKAYFNEIMQIRIKHEVEDYLQFGE